MRKLNRLPTLMKIALGLLCLLVAIVALDATFSCKAAILGGPPTGPCGAGTVYDGGCCPVGFSVDWYGKCAADPEPVDPNGIDAKRRLDAGH